MLLFTGKTRSEPRYVFAACAAFLGSLSIGNALGYSSPAGAEISREVATIDMSFFGSVLTIGALVGGLLAGYSIERFGRKGTILLTTVIFSVGWTLILCKSSPIELYAARFVLGVACGIDCMAVPVYIGEVVLPEKRGIFGAGHQFNCVLGILITYVIGGLGVNASGLAFTCMIPVVLTMIAMLFVPESPMWLIKQKRPLGEISNAVYFFHGKTVRADAQREILIEAQQTQPDSFSLREFGQSSVYRPLLIVFALMLAQQGSGINAIIFYTEKIFDSAGKSIPSSLEAIIVAAVQVVFTIPGALLMDKAGRKILLLISMTAALLGLAMLITFYSVVQSNPSSLPQLAWMPMLALSIFVAGFGVGLGPVPWLMMSELLPAKARGVGTGLCTAFNWFAAFLVTTFFHSMIDASKESLAYGIFATITAIAIAFVLLCVPETKGKSLEDIEAMFNSPEGLVLSSIDANQAGQLKNDSVEIQ